MAIFHLFTLARGLARLGFEHVNCVHLVLSSESTEGPCTGLTMMLPTCDPDYLDPDFFDDWLETIQGPIITAAADDDDDHRAFLLRVVLTYRAFAQRNPALNMDDYVVFTGMFVQAALALQVNDDAATDLQAIDDWMTETIPLEILEPRDLPPRTEVQFGAPPVAWRIPGHTVISTDNWTSPNLDTTRRPETIHILSSVPAYSHAFAAGSTPAVTGTSAGAGSTAAATGTPAGTTAPAPAPATAPAPAPAAAAEAATAADNDEGFESDSYSDMPSLKTASDGSDFE